MATIIVSELTKRAGVTIKGGQPMNQSLTALVLISLFTDARASESDALPDGSGDRRGWPGDSFYDAPWGSRLWLLSREKLTTDVRNRAVTYAEEALAWFTVDDGNGALAQKVTVTGSIPIFQMLALHITIVMPTGEQLTLTVNKRWESNHAV
ncbi:phage GP46 family protein [Photobacterium damselae]|uniref:phage GP46 family protein n=1 Tax=Photobacterium damselae TaxID=38293 RepID=UPI0035A888E3